MSLCSFCGRSTFTPRVSVDFPALYNRLCSESGPTSVQPDEVAAILENVRRDLQDYETDNHNHRLRSCTVRTAEKQERLRTYGTQVRSLLSPIRKIPDEILQHIFDISCDTNTFVFVYYPEDGSLVPSALRGKPAMVINNVCLRWRRNALSLPAIWSRITVHWYWEMQPMDDHELNSHLELFTHLYNFLERSQQWPMMISLDLGYYDPFLQQETKALHPFLMQLLAQTSRCQLLSISGGLNGIGELFQDLPPVSFPNLNTLHIIDDIESIDLALFIGTSPLLKELKVPILELDWDFPYSQLSRLGFHHCYPTNDIANVFNRCSNLSSLEIKDTWSAPSYPTPISHSSRLDVLTIRHEEWDGTYGPYPDTSVLPYLEFPSLKILHLKKPCLWDEEISGPVDKIWTNFGPFIDFVRRSSFPLTTLSIECLPFSDSNLVDLLTLLPTLQDFTLDDRFIPPQFSPVSSKFIESLHGHHSSSLRPQVTPIIPRLKSLRLLNVSAVTFNDTSVVEMVQSRWIPDKLCTTGTSAFDVDCLRVFTMEFRDRLKEEAGDVYDSLNDIERSGMMVVVSWCGTE